MALSPTLDTTADGSKDERFLYGKSVEPMPHLADYQGPFVRLADRTILTLTTRHAHHSSDEGKSWEAHGVFADDAPEDIRGERAMRLLPSGAIVAAFLTNADRNWTWDNDLMDAPGATLKTCTVRSLDGGKTWTDLQTVQTVWSGAVREMEFNARGELVFTNMVLLHDPGRHACWNYITRDEGLSWEHGNFIDLGGAGHHEGATEPALLRLRNGRMWLLIRTNLGVFYNAYSDDGQWFRELEPSDIDASSSPASLDRLQSGRVLMVWNRFGPADGSEPTLRPPGPACSQPSSFYRLELVAALSEDDGKTWTRPYLLARIHEGKPDISYPYVFEREPGELWITTMRGGLRVRIDEQTLLNA